MHYIDQFYSGLFPYTCFGTLKFHFRGFFYATVLKPRVDKYSEHFKSCTMCTVIN
jgi:hypothetical protein